jgi:hypothetical protein
LRELLPSYRKAGRELVAIVERNPGSLAGGLEALSAARSALGEEYTDMFLKIGRGEIGPEALLIRLTQDAAKEEEAA